MSATDHAVLAPSSLNTVRWCPGSVQLARMYPEADDSQDAREGTASHWAGSEQLDGHAVDVGQVAPNNVTLDVAMIEGADMYVETVRRYVPIGGQVEQRVDCSHIHPFMWGTPDFWHYDPATRTLYVLDYKYGRRFVDAYENWQLIAYAAGIITTTDARGAAQVVFGIIQPRNFHRDGPVREWRISAFDLRRYVDALRAAAYAAVNSDGSYVAGAKCVVNTGCKDCTGRRACVTLQTAAMSDIDLAGAPIPFDLPAAAVGTELRMIERAIDQLKARASGLEEQAIAAMQLGVDVPWYRLARSEGRNKWTRPVPEILALGSMLGVQLGKPPEAITPTQAIKAGLSPDLIATYSARQGGELKLVPDDGSLAQRVFG